MSQPRADHDTTLRPVPDRDITGVVALAAAIISLTGFAVLVIGHFIDPSAFNNGKHPSAADFVAFYAYVFGLLIALFLGGATWFYGRRVRQAKPRARIAACYGIVFIIVGIVVAALGG